MTGLKRGIKELDFDAIASYEVSKLFSIRRNQNTLTTDYDLKDIMKFDTSYERFRSLMEEDDFIEVLIFNVICLGIFSMSKRNSIFS